MSFGCRTTAHVFTEAPRACRPDFLKIRVVNDYDALSRLAADLVLRELKRKPELILCASAGGTPTGLYQRLAASCSRQPALFRKLRLLQIDEWQGLPPGHPARCEADLRRKLLEPLGIPPARFIRFDSATPAPELECERVNRWLATHGPIDICILGLGTNGHVAMNEPAAELMPKAHVARLAASSKQHPLLSTLPHKPRFGLTLGIGDILCSRKVLMLVSGAAKRAAMARLAQPRVSTRFPASFLWLHPDATVLCDRASFLDANAKS